MWYRIDLDPDGDTWLATSPDFEEVISFGTTIPEACAHGRDAIEEAIAARIAHGEGLPHPSRQRNSTYAVHMPVNVQMKSALYMILRSEGLTRADLQRKMGLAHREQVDRIFRLDHNTHIDTLMAAFDALGLPVQIHIPIPDAA